jgi:hypothetical protein
MYTLFSTIFHNAYLCKDVGYFYEDFCLKDASSILEKVLENHDINKDQYLKDNRKAIVFLARQHPG